MNDIHMLNYINNNNNKNNKKNTYLELDNTEIDNTEIDITDINKFYQIKINDECCICLEDPEYSENFIKLNCCKQLIHKDCLLKWIIIKENNENCPLCRLQMKIDEMYTIEDFLNNLKINNLKNKNTNKNIQNILQKWYNLSDIHIPKHYRAFINNGERDIYDIETDTFQDDEPVNRSYIILNIMGYITSIIFIGIIFYIIIFGLNR